MTKTLAFSATPKLFLISTEKANGHDYAVDPKQRATVTGYVGSQISREPAKFAQQISSRRFPAKLALIQQEFSIV